MKNTLFTLTLLFVSFIGIAQDDNNGTNQDDEYTKFTYSAGVGLGFASVNLENTAYATLSSLYAGFGVQYNFNNRFGIRASINTSTYRGDMNITGIPYDVEYNNLGLNLQAVNKLPIGTTDLSASLGLNVQTQLYNSYRSYAVDNIKNLDRGSNVQLSSGIGIHLPSSKKHEFYIGLRSFIDLFQFGYDKGRDLRIESNNLLTLRFSY